MLASLTSRCQTQIYEAQPDLWRRYAMAVVFTAVALSLTMLVPLLKEHATFLLFLTAVAASASYGGLGPALLSMIIAGLGSTVFLLPSLYSFDSANWASLVPLLTFLMVALLIGSVNSRSRRAQDQVIKILKSITDGFILFDKNWRYVYLNDSAADLARRSRKELIGTVVWEQFPDTVTSILYTECHKAMADNTPRHFEYFYPPFKEWFECHAHPTKGGLALYVNDITLRRQTTALILEYNQELEQRVADRTRELEAAYAATIKQVAERTQVEVALRDSEQRFRSLADSANDAIVSADSGGLILSWNVAAEAIFGYSAKEVIGQPLTLLMPNRYRDGHQRGMQRLREGGESRVIGKTLEVHGLKKDGSEFALELSLAAWKTGESSFFSGIIRDITARKEAEEELERFRLLVEGVVDYAILMLDPAGHIVSWNAGAQRLKGYQTDEIIGRHFSCFYPPEDIQSGKPEHELKVATAEGRLEDSGWRVRKDGTRFWAKVIITAMRDESGRLRGFSKVTRDLTERKQAEEALAERAAELVRSNAELQQFASVASHDLQEPLRMVASYTQLLASRYEQKLGPEASCFMKYIVEGATRMGKLIEDILAYSLFDPKKKDYKMVDCEAVLTSALRNLEHTIQESGAKITHDKLPHIAAVPAQLTQVFQNLIGNAIKFRTTEAPEIHISAERPFQGPNNMAWLFSVSDNGLGIPQEYGEQIFEVFKRLHLRHEYPGTGIGLAICKKVIEGHAGQIWVKSQPGKGSTFFFTLPSTGGNNGHA